MRNIIGPPVVGDDLYGRDYELARLWEHLENGEHILMLAPRRVGKTSLMLELKSSKRRVTTGTSFPSTLRVVTARKTA